MRGRGAAGAGALNSASRTGCLAFCDGDVLIPVSSAGC
ncbi:hypothetical protein ACCUM_4307 [Candidatus Accumulibacter phosphatis]|uniref:Uncharacterized protein n=1 Tax=Candidatus Accumulibacter phosphatis TaxID=327160 RepID=A0A5S4EM45_9PROT|nr:hypothetical protein ACCUM_4307 [Candidatus Accumulibacter phosphatis]